MKKTVFTAN